jgi:CheY-like chemotaxis protein
MRVLVVEDEPLVALDFEGMLEDAGFGSVAVAPAVARALGLLGADGFDVAILDANLGGESAEPVARALNGRGIPLPGISGYAQDQRPEVLRQAPFLGKPFSPDALIRALRRLVPDPEGS